MRQPKPGARAALGLVLALICAGTAPVRAQETAGSSGAEFQLGLPQSGILTIQPDRLFSESAFGKRVEREIEAEGAVLTAENRRIEAELRKEELDLTERRSEMEPEAFRALADAFDEKVQETRRRQDQKLREITQMGEDARREFIKASLPVLQQIMREAGAGAILDHSSVFLSADAADITALAIARIDAVLGDGAADEDGDR
ncbi:outer membrane chaperone Skp [Leisingera sp. ANG1]|nr:outer membrane chaperone Skp [Leisingera sp. ANG-DT]KIC26622.1 outer membrane chaperone Skp [Leisingera sp. ANG-S3]KIC33664.1 outer membrane chaperone Skp [Leisingera sp. ANG-S5]KIC53849.1 outer membrane chaperone Skp [Leisingera sp. ANG-S]KID10338.1 outer membrane chaperone Skp [Leisingera sp. ANG1]